MSDRLCLKCRLHPSRRTHCKDCRIATLEAENAKLRDACDEALCIVEYEPFNVRSLLPILRSALVGGDDE